MVMLLLLFNATSPVAGILCECVYVCVCVYACVCMHVCMDVCIVCVYWRRGKAERVKHVGSSCHLPTFFISTIQNSNCTNGSI